jgi:hypothetical protein
MDGLLLSGAAWRGIVMRLRRFRIRRELKNIRYECEFIRRQRAHDYHVERILYAREAMLRSELNTL